MHLCPYTRNQQTWLAHRGAGSQWGAGCWACFSAKLSMRCGFARLELKSITSFKLSTFLRHQNSKGHLGSLAALAAQAQQVRGQMSDDVGAVSGISADVPRLDRFVLAADVVAGACTMEDFGRLLGAHDVGSALPETADRSRKVFRQILISLAEPLRQQNVEVLRHTRRASIALDERHQVMLVMCRCLTPTGLWDIMLGLDRDFGYGPRAVASAVRRILQRACTLRHGRRDISNAEFTAPTDEFDQQLFDNFRSKVVAAVADGGPSAPQHDCPIPMLQVQLPLSRQTSEQLPSWIFLLAWLLLILM